MKHLESDATNCDLCKHDILQCPYVQILNKPRQVSSKSQQDSEHERWVKEDPYEQSHYAHLSLTCFVALYIFLLEQIIYKCTKNPPNELSFVNEWLTPNCVFQKLIAFAFF